MSGCAAAPVPPTTATLGYGQARYFWSLLAAVGIFVIGGLLAILDGVQSLRHPEPLTNVGVGVAVLVVSAGLEGCRGAPRTGSSAPRPMPATSTSATTWPSPRTRRRPRCSWRTLAALVGLALAWWRWCCIW